METASVTNCSQVNMGNQFEIPFYALAQVTHQVLCPVKKKSFVIFCLEIAYAV